MARLQSVYTRQHIDVYIDVSAYHQVLMIPVRCLHLLFIRTHETLNRLDTLCDLGIMNLEQQSQLSGYRIFDLCNLVTRRSDLNELLLLHLVLCNRLLRLQLLCIYRCIL